MDVAGSTLLRQSKSTTALRAPALRRTLTASALNQHMLSYEPSRELAPLKRSTSPAQTPAQQDTFLCHICLDSARNAIVTACGHLYCWECLYGWLVTPAQLDCPSCPVCKSGCEVSSLTPIYDHSDAVLQPTACAQASSKMRTFSSSSQTKPKNVFDQWLVPHIHPPSLAILPDGAIPARPVARPRPAQRKRPLAPNHVHTAGLFGGAHPIVLFSAGITTFCGMHFIQNGGFGNDLQQDTFNTSRMLTLLAFFIIAGVWFH